MEKREVDLVVISDVHLGTFGCRAEELYRYLKSIKPETLVLNGDIIDIWQFRKRFFPKWHLKVIKQLFALAAKGTKVYYLTGNHDESLRRFSDMSMGNITLADKLVLDLNGEKAWFFHGDIFDASIQNAKWIAKLGGWGYDLLILVNAFSNWCLLKMGRERYSFSKKIKNSVKEAVKYITNFENTASELAIDHGYTYVACGHIHQPQMRWIKGDKGKVLYLNSGDWIENLTSLEYHRAKWSLFQYQEENFKKIADEEDNLNDLDIRKIIQKVTLRDGELEKSA